MKSNQNRPVWPYLGVLVCLFVLSLTAPRSWQSRTTTTSPVVSESETQPVATVDSSLDASDVAPEEAIAASESLLDLPKIEAPVAVVSEEENPVEEVSPEGHADVATDVEPQGPLLVVEPQEPTLADPLPQSALVRVTSPDDRIALLPAHPPTVPSMEVTPQHEDPLQSIVRTPGSQALPEWTVPKRLLAELRELADHEPTSAWATSTSWLVRHLTEENPENPRDTKNLLTDLRRAIDEARTLSASLQPPELRTHLLRVRYAVARRMAIWELVDQHREFFETVPRDATLVKTGVSQSLAEVAALTGKSAQGKAWSDYLMLDSLRNVLQGDEDPTKAQRRETARRVMGQIAAARTSRPESRFLRGGPMVAFGDALRRWSAAPVDPRELLSNLERYEVSGDRSDARRVADDYQRLALSPVDEQQALSKRLEQHYRNANLRIALSAEMLDRWLPQPKPVQGHVNDRIMGADVEGESYTTTKLGVRLLPNPRQLRLGLEARGVVHSETASSSGPATFHSTGQTEYLAHKIITYDHRGLRIAPAIASADSDSDLENVNTSFDGIPLLGSVFRNYATSQHEKSHGEAMSEVEQRVASTVRQRLDTIANREISKAAEKFKQQVLAPLKQLSLEPEMLETLTTDQRVIMRLRLAEEHQLGAHTPRPRAPSDSHASLQLHQSVLNNAIGQLQLDGKTFKLPDLYEHLSERLGRQIDPPEDLSERAKITFADEDAVRVRCDKGRMEVSFNVEQLAQGKNRFRNFQVRAYYRPEHQGLQTQLVRDGSIQLQGSRLRTRSQIVLRGVFSKVFSRNRPFDLIDAERAADSRFQGLVVTQMVLDDGWLAMAIGPQRRAPTKALRPRPSRYRR